MLGRCRGVHRRLDGAPNGLNNVVATMGTALTPLHIRQLHRYAPKVILVYDADAGGTTGVDRRLGVVYPRGRRFGDRHAAGRERPVRLIGRAGRRTVPVGLDEARDALDYKLDQVWQKSVGEGIEGTRRAVDAVLGVLCLVPMDAGASVA